MTHGPSVSEEESLSHSHSRWLGLAALATVAAAAFAFQAWPFRDVLWIGGDIEYHQDLIRQIVQGHFPADGPYRGLPAYYPPGYHLMMAGIASLSGLDALDAIRLASFALVPLLPVVAYVAARSLQWTRLDAVLAALVMTFAGGSPGRFLWVWSPIASSHNIWPSYPRDIVLLLTPLVFALLARGTRSVAAPADRGRPSPGVAIALAGGLAGLAVLTETQSGALAVGGAGLFLVGRLVQQRGAPAEALRHLALFIAALCLTCGGWVVMEFRWVWASGGMSLPVPRTRPLPNLIEGAIAWGLVLPAAAIGFWRMSRDPANGTLRMLVLAWAGLPLAMLALRSVVDLDDTAFLAPTRLWLAASQPAALLAGLALAHGYRAVARSSVAAGVLLLALVLWFMTVQHGVLNYRNAREHFPPGQSGRLPVALLEAVRALGPPFHDSTVIAAPDPSLALWVGAGHPVVYAKRPSFVKLAFDLEHFTGIDEATRKEDLRAALFEGGARLDTAARRYDANLMVVRSGWSADPAGFRLLERVDGYEIWGRSAPDRAPPP